MRAGALRLLVVLLAVVVVAASCSSRRKGADEPTRTTQVDERPALLCDLVSIPLGYMDEAGVDFVDVVDDESGRGADQGISAMVALGLTARGRSEAGRFEPVLGYLADRFAASADPKGVPVPALTSKVRANAKALDDELERKGCG